MVRYLTICIFFLGLSSIFGQISLSDMMSREEMRKTGINSLNYSQRRALENWIDKKFQIKNTQTHENGKQLFLSLNIEEGKKLELSNGKTYEVAPEDQVYSSFWITPFPIMLSPSGDQKYPVLITNVNTNTSVKSREVSTREAIEGKKPSNARGQTSQ